MFTINFKTSVYSCLFLSIAAFCSPTLAHGPHVNSKPWAVCAQAKLGDVCSYTVHETRLYKGTCRSMSDTLMCVRNQPIETIIPADTSANKSFKTERNIDFNKSSK